MAFNDTFRLSSHMGHISVFTHTPKYKSEIHANMTTVR